MSRLEERIENFNRAFTVFKDAHDQYLKDSNRVVFRLAEIQGFEVLFELSWKVLKDYIEIKGYKEDAPRNVIKKAFLLNYLPNAQIWIDMLKDRNCTSHEYNQKKADEIFERITTIYYDELSSFHNWINTEAKQYV